MEEHVFQTDLSPEEIEKRFENFDFFGTLMESLGEAVDYANGKEVDGIVVTNRQLPDIDVAQVRISVSMTQRAFAAVLGVSTRTVESWECGRSHPTSAARKLIALIQGDHSIVQKLQSI